MAPGSLTVGEASDGAAGCSDGADGGAAVTGAEEGVPVSGPVSVGWPGGEGGVPGDVTVTGAGAATSGGGKGSSVCCPRWTA